MGPTPSSSNYDRMCPFMTEFVLYTTRLVKFYFKSQQRYVFPQAEDSISVISEDSFQEMTSAVPWTPKPLSLCSEKGLQYSVTVHRDQEGGHADYPVMVSVVEGEGLEVREDEGPLSAEGGSQECWWRRSGGRRRGGIEMVDSKTVCEDNDSMLDSNEVDNEIDDVVVMKSEENDNNNDILEDQNMNSENELSCKCRKCGKVCLSRRSLKWHIRDVHSPIIHKCHICEKQFPNKSNVKKHVRMVHEKVKNKMCQTCGKQYHELRDLKCHESVCTAGSPEMKNQRNKKYVCPHCHKKVTTKTKLRMHIHKIHEQQETIEVKTRRDADLECEICSKKLKSSRSLKHHLESIHYSNKEQQQEVDCTECDEKCSSSIMLDEHLMIVHKKELRFPCLLCSKTYKTRKILGDHYRNDHSEKAFTCLVCNQAFGRKSTLQVHVKRHSIPPRPLKPFENLSKSEYNKRRLKIEKRICEEIKKFPELSRKSIVRKIIKENPGAVKEMDPLTEEEIIDMIKDLSISDRVLLQILSHLRKKWGRKVVTKNIKNYLRDRKLLVADFFTVVTLDETTEYNFTDSKGNIVSRQISYCNDIEGLITYKEMLEIEKHGIEIAEDVDQVISVDGGVKKLIMTHTWSPKVKGGLRRKLSQKNTIILAAVAEVPENNHNLKTLFALTQANKLSYLFSSDLKMWLLGLGLGSVGSTYSCGLGECRKESKRGKWIKGPNRTIASIRKARQDWIFETDGNRKKLNKFMNCEHEPVVRPQHDENSPIFHWLRGVI